MSFMSKNPISSPKISEPPEVPHPGTRGLFPMADGWYDIDDEGNVKKLSGDSAGAQLSSDWSQNDDTAPDYVKNRTHYEVPRVVLAEVHRTAEETLMENGFDGICDVFIDKSLAEVGKEYKYTINGQSGTFIFSDEYMEFGEASGSVYDSGNEYDWKTSWAYGSTIDIILYGGGEIKVLDEKYIPDTIARVSDVEEILDELHAYAQNLIGGDA